MNPRNIILVGMMGTGKSSVGKLLADQLDYRLIDLDAKIVEKAGCSIPELFAQKGEAYFRELESEVLASVLEEQEQVIATGGGAVLHLPNCELMKQKGWVAALKADADTIIKRVSGDHNRPLLAGNAEERVRTILEQRKHAYDFAHEVFDTSSYSLVQVSHQILARHRVVS